MCVGFVTESHSSFFESVGWDFSCSMSKRPVSSMSSQEGEEEASSTSAIEQQQQHK